MIEYFGYSADVLDELVDQISPVIPDHPHDVRMAMQYLCDELARLSPLLYEVERYCQGDAATDGALMQAHQMLMDRKSNNGARL
jgi:hypothetical protein